MFKQNRNTHTTKKTNQHTYICLSKNVSFQIRSSKIKEIIWYLDFFIRHDENILLGQSN